MDSARHSQRSSGLPRPAVQSFERLAARDDAPFDELLLALGAEFRPVDRAAARERLDDLARRLFGLPSLEIPAAAQRLADVLGCQVGLRARTGGLGCLFLDEVLRQGAGHPALLAVTYFEAARRAGLRPQLFSAAPAWFVGFGGPEQLTIVDPAPGPTWRLGRQELRLRRRCPHEVAHLVLSALHRHLRSRGNHVAALRAGELAYCLDIEDEDVTATGPRLP